MAIAPSRQFYPTGLFNSFQSSFSKFHANNIQIIRRKPFSPCVGRRNASYGSWISKWDENRRDKYPIHPRAALDYSPSDSEEVSSTGFENSDGVDRGLTYGNNGGSTMEKIVEKLKKFGYMSDGGDKEKTSMKVIEKGSVEDIFYIEEGMLPNTRGGFSVDSPLGVESVFGGKGEIRFPWEKPKEEDRERKLERTKSRTLAEMTLPELELRRLRNLTFQKKHKMKIGGGGVTQAVVDIIHEKWKMSEIVRLKIDGPPALNMKRVHEILERKTGGLVIWRSGTSLSLYRGVSYEDPAPQTHKGIYKNNRISSLPEATDTASIVTSQRGIYKNNRISSLPEATDTASIVTSQRHSYENFQAPKIEIETTAEDNSSNEVSAEVNYEEEVNKLLDDLGPRYKDWPGCDPLPVDADMLQGIVPDYQPPYRILPYGVRRSLGIKEATSLRRLARVLPPHFALGRNRQLQGLALAMIKLWEKSSIAKIALKRGVQLTTSERMAEEIKALTGGFLLSRNKDFLVFYRGKDFLSPDVTEALLERERLAKSLQDEEEHARLRAAALVVPAVKTVDKSGIAGTLGETMDADVKWGRTLDDQHKERVAREAEILRHNNLVRKLERKMSFAERKIAKAEKALFKVEEFLKPTNKQADPESISEEERYMFRKLGLRMKAFLLLGRRGVFDGTVENMHLHWKYRELVKIMVKTNSFEQVKKIALALEAESGGVLVSVDKVSKAYAIIVFRGKDYQRPSLLRPKNLLTKRKALARSIELQRHEALVNHISALQSKVDKLRSEIEQMENVKNQGNGTLYDKLESAYPTDDETETEDGEDGDSHEGPYMEDDGEDESNIADCDHNEDIHLLYNDRDEESEAERERAFFGSI